METIYKYKVEVTDYPTIEMPKGAKILTVQTQGVIPHIWAIVDTEQKETETRKFGIVGTGYPLNIRREYREYIGTFQQMQFVWHLFEIKENNHVN